MVRDNRLEGLRYRAENMLRTLESTEPAIGSDVDLRELAEELRVYQAELDIQNQELQEANRALITLQMHYWSLFEHLPVPAMVVQHNGTVLESNQAAQKRFPLLATPTAVRSVYSLLAHRADGRLSDMFRDALSAGHEGQQEVLFHSDIQHEHPFAAFVHAMPDVGPSGQQMLLLLVDRLAERRERAWADRFRKIAEHVPGMLYQFEARPDGQISFPFSTEGIQRIYGVTPEAAKADAQSVIARIHSDDVAQVVESIQQSQAQLSVWRCRYRVALPDGQTIWVEGESAPERLPDGSTLWHGYIRDITRAVALEEAVREEKNRLANVIWGTGVGTWEWNVHTGEVRFNEQWAHMLGYSLDELAPITIHTWMRLCHSDDLKRSEEQLNKHFCGESDYYECEARMLHRNGRWRWVLDRGRVITRTPDGHPEWMAGTHLDITERKIMEERLDRLAHHDPLTGLPRRDLFEDRMMQAMAQSRRRQTRVAVAFIDLDGFKRVNDENGHAAGDALLVEVANRMLSLLRAGDTVARLGGDEFVMLLTDLQPSDDGVKHVERIMIALSEPVRYQGNDLRVTSSVGIVHYPDAGDVTGDELMRRADKAMYAAKAAGKNRVVVV